MPCMAFSAWRLVATVTVLPPDPPTSRSRERPPPTGTQWKGYNYLLPVRGNACMHAMSKSHSDCSDLCDIQRRLCGYDMIRHGLIQHPHAYKVHMSKVHCVTAGTATHSSRPSTQLVQLTQRRACNIGNEALSLHVMKFVEFRPTLTGIDLRQFGHLAVWVMIASLERNPIT